MAPLSLPPLYAERIRRRRRLPEDETERWQIVGARHAIVREGAGNELTAPIVNDALHHRLPYSLRKTSVHLPLDDHRIDDHAAIVGREIVAQA